VNYAIILDFILTVCTHSKIYWKRIYRKRVVKAVKLEKLSNLKVRSTRIRGNFTLNKHHCSWAPAEVQTKIIRGI